jgi:hypothetical protein
VGQHYIFLDTISTLNAYVLVGFRSVTGQVASTKGLLPVGVKEQYVKLESDVTYDAAQERPAAKT